VGLWCSTRSRCAAFVTRPNGSQFLESSEGLRVWRAVESLNTVEEAQDKAGGGSGWTSMDCPEPQECILAASSQSSTDGLLLLRTTPAR
jgi:hypothetical protein